MKHLFQATFTILFCAVMLLSGHAQDVKNVDVNSLPQSEIDKAQKAMKDAGLSPQQAAALARQKGASEQQIMDMENRLNGSFDTTQAISNPSEDVAKYTEQLQNEEKSTRTNTFETDNTIFGSYLFNNKNLTFEPSINIQTPKNYEINIGDQLLISIWGNSQSSYQLSINQNGQVLIPDVGPVYLAGLSFADATKKIKKRLTSIYADMGGDNPQTFAQVNMGQLRAIRVNIVGEAGTPGTYTLPATASVFNALYLSGGPNNIGSFRNIRIIRNNKTVKDIDIYSFLIDADPSGNIQLKDNDIIFIPPVEKRVQVNGHFRRNGFFELKENESLADLIRFAGGYTENAYQQKVQVYRKTQERQQIIDVDFNKLNTTALMDGDKVRNAEVLDLFENRVSITGAVYRPGEYEWTLGLTLFDLIIKADSLKEDAFQNRGLITRQNKDLTTTTIPFNVQQVASREIDIELLPEDIVSIKSHFDIGETPFVTINGEVMEEGQVPWSEKLTVADVLFMAGGFTEAADSTYIEISRRLSYEEASSLTDTLVHVYVINHERALNLNSETEPFALQAYDIISVKRAPGYREQGVATVAGEVVYAGTYAIRNKNERISDLIKLAKGITPQAFTDGATLRRNTTELGSENIAINLGEILNNPHGENDLFLRDGDMLFIPEFAQTVKVMGSVQNPFSLTYHGGEKAKYYINQSGGFDQDANKKRVYVQHANGYAVPTKSFLGIRNYPEVKPGSQIIVPKKPEKKPGNGQWIAIVSVLSSLALSAATIVSLTK